MGLSLRKSINLGGGFRINVSKSGIGYSWGKKGFRISRSPDGKIRKSVNIPELGIKYSDVSKKEKKEEFENEKPKEIIYDARIEDIKRAIEKSLKLNTIGNLLLFSGILILLSNYFIFLFLLGIILKIIAFKICVKLEYQLDDEKAEEYQHRLGAWKILFESKRIIDTFTQKRFSLATKLPYFIKTNIDCMAVNAAGNVLIILPDILIYCVRSKFFLAEYKDITVTLSIEQQPEKNSVPEDASVIGQTYLHTKKDGSPDKRYKYNPVYPLCEYGVILISSSSFKIEMEVSNQQKARDFSQLFE